MSKDTIYRQDAIDAIVQYLGRVNRDFKNWEGTARIILDHVPSAQPERKIVEDEVWGFASMLMNMHPDVAEDIYWSMNGGKGIGVAAEMTYHEAKAQYDTWRKQKDEIRVGDEVVDTETDKGVVTYIRGYLCDVLWDDGGVTEEVEKEELCKTGRHFDEVEELLKKMRDTE